MNRPEKHWVHFLFFFILWAFFGLKVLVAIKFSKYWKLIGSITPIIPIILRLTVTKGKGWITQCSSEDIARGNFEQNVSNTYLTTLVTPGRVNRYSKMLAWESHVSRQEDIYWRLVSCSVPLGLLSAPASQRFKIIYFRSILLDDPLKLKMTNKNWEFIWPLSN